MGMNKHRRRVSAIFAASAALVVLVVLAACGGPGAGTRSRTAASQAAAPRTTTPGTSPPTTTARQPPPCATARCVVDHVFPGATVSYGRAPSGAAGPLRLDMRLPPSVKPLSGSAADKAFVADDTGWRGGLAFAAARALDPRIGAFRLTYANGTAPPGPDGNDYHGGVMRLPPGAHRVRMPNLDRLSVPVALKQMRSNLHVLDQAIGLGAVAGQQIHVIALDPARRRFALDVTVDLRDRDALRGHLCDLLDGLSTGVGGSGQGWIEGLGITAAVDGRPIAGGWSSARLMSGSIEVADGINYPGDNGALSHFPDLTGGPHAACSAPG